MTERNGLPTFMLQSTRNSAYTCCLVLVVITLFAACSSFKKTPTPPKSLLTISFQKSFDIGTAPYPSYSSDFEITDFHSSPGATSSEKGYLYTEQKYCLKGTAVLKPGEVATKGPSEVPRDTSVFCFSINDPIPYSLYAPPIHPGVFPIAQFYPGKMFTHELNKLTLVRLDLKDYDERAWVARDRPVIFENHNGSGTIEITAAEEKRLAGNISINDGNLSVTGTFDCPLR